MVFDFSSRSWGDSIAAITEQVQYQTCKIRINWSGEVLEAYDYRTNETFRVAKALSEVAATGDDPSLLSALGVDPSARVSRQNTGTPVGEDGDVWVRLIDRVHVVFVFAGKWAPVPSQTEVYSGQARFIPVRSGVWQGGEAQLNATTIRAVRFQVPFSKLPGRVHSGSIVTIIEAPDNPNLQGRTAKVTDDFQGSTTASRTFHAMMDADSEDL